LVVGEEHPTEEHLCVEGFKKKGVFEMIGNSWSLFRRISTKKANVSMIKLSLCICFSIFLLSFVQQGFLKIFLKRRGGGSPNKLLNIYKFIIIFCS